MLMEYDPALIAITGVSVGPGMPEDASANINRVWPEGRIALSFTSETPVAAGPAEFVLLAAEVPSSAPLGDRHVLEMTIVQINAGAIVPTLDQAMHLVGFLGDTTGDGNYTGLDAQRAARVTVGLDAGFEAFPLIDPMIVADVTASGDLTGLDAQRIAQAAVGLNPSEIPPPPTHGFTARSPQVGQASLPAGKNQMRQASANQVGQGFLPAGKYEKSPQAALGADLPTASDGATEGPLAADFFSPWAPVEFLEVARAENRSRIRQDLAQVEQRTVAMHPLVHVPGRKHDNERLMDDTLTLHEPRLPDYLLNGLFEKYDEATDLLRKDTLATQTVDDAFASLASP
jgi:hypothetical protein